MPFAIICPSCGQRLYVQDDAIGKKVRCRKCSAGLRVTAPVETPVNVMNRAPPPVRQAKPVPFVLPAPGVQPARRSTWWVWCIAGLGGLMLVGLIVGIKRPDEGKGENRRPPKKEAEASTRIDATELLAQYHENGVAADQAFRHQVIEVRGFVRAVDRSFGSAYVILGGAEEFEILGVQCMFSRKNETTLASLRQGDVISIIGRCEGRTLNVVLRDCRLR